MPATVGSGKFSIAFPHRRHGVDKSVLSCLVRVGGVNTLGGEKVIQFCLVSTQFPICNCSVSNILRITENLEIGNWVETRQNCLVLSPSVFTPPTRTWQDKTVLSSPCRRWEQLFRLTHTTVQDSLVLLGLGSVAAWWSQESAKKQLARYLVIL